MQDLTIAELLRALRPFAGVSIGSRRIDEENVWNSLKAKHFRRAREVYDRMTAKEGRMMDNVIKTRRANSMNFLVAECHSASMRAGWWNDLVTGASLLEEKNMVPTKLVLIHSEVSEALEGHRKSKLDEHLPHRKSIEVELADAVIRICDLAGALNLDLGAALAEKMEYNARRADHKWESRLAEGGKKF